MVIVFQVGADVCSGSLESNVLSFKGLIATGCGVHAPGMGAGVMATRLYGIVHIVLACSGQQFFICSQSTVRAARCMGASLEDNWGQGRGISCSAG